LRPDRAVPAISDGIDWRDVEALIDNGCSLELAIEIVR
jgi:hypothetical protein